MVHRASAKLEVKRRDGLPVTSVQRTLDDLHRTDRAAADQATNEAMLRRLIPRTHAGAPFATRSEAERALVRLMTRAGLPPDDTNARVAGRDVDLLSRRQRLVVEMDGWAYHGDRAAFERDRRRDQDLLAAGYRVLRVTWRQLTEEPEAVVAAIARAQTAR